MDKQGSLKVVHMPSCHVGMRLVSNGGRQSDRVGQRGQRLLHATFKRFLSLASQHAHYSSPQVQPQMEVTSGEWPAFLAGNGGFNVKHCGPFLFSSRITKAGALLKVLTELVQSVCCSPQRGDLLAAFGSMPLKSLGQVTPPCSCVILVHCQRPPLLKSAVGFSAKITKLSIQRGRNSPKLIRKMKSLIGKMCHESQILHGLYGQNLAFKDCQQSSLVKMVYCNLQINCGTSQS